MKFLIGTFLWALTLIAVCEKVDVYRTGYAIEQLRAEKKQAQHEQRSRDQVPRELGVRIVELSER